LNQFLLIARQMEIGRVERLAFIIVVRADDDDGDIRLRGQSRRRVEVGGRPRAGARAALGKCHGDVIARRLLDAVEDADPVERGDIRAPPSAKLRVGGVRADHGDGLNGCPVERQKMPLVLEQRDSLLRGLERQCPMRGSVDLRLAGRVRRRRAV
jgi:hypothetical protein